jgi:hypothetical protein
MAISIEDKLRLHPMRRQLVAYAESLVDPGTPVSAQIGAHVAQCRQCAEEVRAIRASLEFTAAAPGLEPSRNLTGEILRSARRERNAAKQQRQETSRIGAFLRGFTFLGATAAVAVLVFGFFLREAIPAQPARIAPATATASAAPAMPSAESLQKTAAEVRALAAALREVPDSAPSPHELRQRRAVQAMDADIAAALTALERNPGCVRASHIVNANLQRQAQALRNLYVERKL